MFNAQASEQQTDGRDKVNGGATPGGSELPVNHLQTPNHLQNTAQRWPNGGPTGGPTVWPAKGPVAIVPRYYRSRQFFVYLDISKCTARKESITEDLTVLIA